MFMVSTGSLVNSFDQSFLLIPSQLILCKKKTKNKNEFYLCFIHVYAHSCNISFISLYQISLYSRISQGLCIHCNYEITLLEFLWKNLKYNWINKCVIFSDPGFSFHIISTSTYFIDVHIKTYSLVYLLQQLVFSGTFFIKTCLIIKILGFTYPKPFLIARS